ncbi:hypothetical protein ANO14919_049910 [Xylariales sp. No.14919]|nr:hypothetical protein ANO14919_049910 [Xylariales sp. No.14919]
MSGVPGPTTTPSDLRLGVAEQSCKECRRRKARCDREIPICSLCVKYSRHCLYEKHARTPLTRRHLTEVEVRLEKAEALIRRLRRDGDTALDNGASAATPFLIDAAEPRGNSGPVEVAGDLQSSIDPIPPIGGQLKGPPQWAVQREARSTRPDRPSPQGPSGAENWSGHPRPAQHTPLHQPWRGQDLVETPPREDFEWDELDVVRPQSPAASAAIDTSEEVYIKDGMASLAVDEKDGGYLGVASGAALLRILEPSSRIRRFSHSSPPRPHMPFLIQPDPNRHITDTIVDAYFATYHLSYPIIHEPTFRAQYSEVIPQPHGRSWPILAYIIAAIGVYCSSTKYSDLEFQLFTHSRSMLTFDYLEMSNSTLVQALTLISNYQQKRDKPNSGYNYLGLAVRMATGLGFHKEFPGWNISPLKMEMRRRIWWALGIFDIGATITFSRPILWPLEGVEVSFPLNVTDRELTANSKGYPPENPGVTTHTAVSVQARFHVSTNEIYSRVISKPLPTADELLWLDQEFLEPWQATLPAYFNDTSSVPPKYAFAQAVMKWRRRNFRIIMYRPFVIRKALNVRGAQIEESEADLEAYKRCIVEAESTIDDISDYWFKNDHNNLTAWYSLYFLFQAALIPCICLRNDPFDADAPKWAQQIETTLRTIKAFGPSNSSANRCSQVIVDLCGKYLSGVGSQNPQESISHQVDTLEHSKDGGKAPPQSQVSLNTPPSQGMVQEHLEPISESPQTQLGGVFPMMWPNINTFEAADEVMGDDAWVEFLGGGVRSGEPQY